MRALWRGRGGAAASGDLRTTESGDELLTGRSSLVRQAYGFARAAHAGQHQEADGSPYVNHVIVVARLLDGADYDEEVLAAGLLHDVVERTTATLENVRERFGERVAELVAAMTEPTDVEPFGVRKSVHREAIARSDSDAQAIFAADKLANTRALREGIEISGRPAVQGRLSKPLDHKLDHYEATCELLARDRDPVPFTDALRAELAQIRETAGQGG